MSGLVFNIAMNLADYYTLRTLFPVYTKEGNRVTQTETDIDVITKYLRANIPNTTAEDYMDIIGNPASKAYTDAVTAWKDFTKQLAKDTPQVGPDNKNPITALVYFFGTVIENARELHLTGLNAEFSLTRLGNTLMINQILRDPKAVANDIMQDIRDAMGGAMTPSPSLTR